MRCLLDTHALLWSVINPEPLSPAAARLFAEPETILLVSAASAWEIATKVRLGKLPRAEAFERNFLAVLGKLEYPLLSVTAKVALEAGRFAVEHRDPFDRIIAAQALDLDIPVVSADAKLDLFGVRRIW